jgi:hypothetical protein
MTDQPERRKITFAPRPNAGAQSRFLHSADRYPALIMGLGGGKTWAGATWLLMGHLSYPRVNSLGVEPTVQNLRQIMLPMLIERIEEIGLRYETRLSPDDMAIKTPELRSQILLHSGMKAERITGFEVGRAWIDEPARIPDFAESQRNVWTNVIARVRDRRVKHDDRRVAITGTHEGKGSWVWRDWEQHPKEGHVVFRGATDENPTSREYAELLRVEYGPDLAEQYILGRAIDESAAAIDYATIQGLQEASCTREVNWTRLGSLPYPLFGGMDIGRKASLTVVWVWMRNPIDGKLHTEAVVELKQAAFAEQQGLVSRLCELPNFQMLNIDATYNPQTAEDAVAANPYKCEGVVFTNKEKLGLAERIVGAAQGGLLAIPMGDDILADWHSVKRVVTPGGVVKFIAPFTADGHADRFWAAALGCRAAAIEDFGPVTCSLSAPITSGQGIAERRSVW